MELLRTDLTEENVDQLAVTSTSTAILAAKRTHEYVNTEFLLQFNFIYEFFASVLTITTLPWYEPSDNVKQLCVASFQAPSSRFPQCLPNNSVFKMLK